MTATPLPNNASACPPADFKKRCGTLPRTTTTSPLPKPKWPSTFAKRLAARRRLPYVKSRHTPFRPIQRSASRSPFPPAVCRSMASCALCSGRGRLGAVQPASGLCPGQLRARPFVIAQIGRHPAGGGGLHDRGNRARFPVGSGTGSFSHRSVHEQLDCQGPRGGRSMQPSRSPWHAQRPGCSGQSVLPAVPPREWTSPRESTIARSCRTGDRRG